MLIVAARDFLQADAGLSAYRIPIQDETEILDDKGRPATQVADCTGYRIGARTLVETVARIANCLVKRARDPELRERLGRCGRRLVLDQFQWSWKAEVSAGQD